MFGFWISNNKEDLTLKLMISIIVFGILFGGLMEICQHYIFINRSGNWYDFTANTIGAILGVVLYPQLLKLLPLKR
jgi:VanZ family protein